MKLIVYKGFDLDFLSSLRDRPLVARPIEEKTNVLNFDKKTRKQLEIALLSWEEGTAWVTYEEYSLLKTRVDDAIAEDGLELVVFRNNLYPDYYPLPFELEDDLAREIFRTINGESVADNSEACQKYLAVYNTLVSIEGQYYGSFYNFEYDRDDAVHLRDYYPSAIPIEDDGGTGEYSVFLNEDIETYLRDLTRIKAQKPGVISLKSTDGIAAKRMQLSLQAYCAQNGIRLVKFHEKLPEVEDMERELISIAQHDIGIEGFTDFRKIRFYKNPDIDKEIVALSQSQIIREIIRQAENAYQSDEKNSFRDIFITASTGAGKSVMFQIPAVYLAKKYHKLTIIIEPVKALMQDQKEKLNRNGYNRVASFNSDLISQVEKEAVLAQIKSGEVDLLYLSPETLLSYSIETIIGDREIGLLIVDEAHIVTTWGVGFRPDYWYLGTYLNRLRNQIQTNKGKKNRTYQFPICAFTATAVNGGIDDSISDTIISLYMENPIKYIGYVRRDDIRFDIRHIGTNRKLPKPEYEAEKTKALNDRLTQWLANKQKVIAYFPYASLAGAAAKGTNGFAGITRDQRIGTYTGRNIDELSNEAFTEVKRQTFEGFREGRTPIMLATKAFGMGVDVNDVDCVYHYAVTGSLCDYVQEIGRAARKESMTGTAAADCLFGDFSFMKTLFGMSRIRQYQVRKVLEGIYDTYRRKNGARSFLISPESFTYIFNGKDEGECINQLKTCLLMLEKDFADKYNFKVIISRPQSVFTKAFVCVTREEETRVLSSRYGQYFKFVERGRFQEKQADGTILSDNGDIYQIDLEKIWESFHQNISFPQFKYWYFNPNSRDKNSVSIMPEIRSFIAPRQRVSVSARDERMMSELRQAILEDFEYIANQLYANYRRQYFSTEDLESILRERFGKSKAKIIANSLFDLVDPKHLCVKLRYNEGTGKTCYSLANGNFKEFMRRPINRSRLISNLTRVTDSSSYNGYLSLTTDDCSMVALKLLSIFDYITYEVVGGSEPEIFIRLNDPNKIKSIVMGNANYSNSYITKAKQKHDRDVEVLLYFFNQLNTDEERWDYIENYFLGYDVLSGIKPANINAVKLKRMILKRRSYPTNMLRSWADLKGFFKAAEHGTLKELEALDIRMPDYLQTELKKTDMGSYVLMSWAEEEVLICRDDSSDAAMEFYRVRGWHAYKISEIDFEDLESVFFPDKVRENAEQEAPAEDLHMDEDFGMNMRDSSWKEVWENVLGLVDQPAEKSFVRRMADQAAAFRGKEKPYFDCVFAVNQEYECALIWPRSKVMLFSEESRDGFAPARTAGWTCFVTGDETLTPDMLVSVLKEE